MSPGDSPYPRSTTVSFRSDPGAVFALGIGLPVRNPLFRKLVASRPCVSDVHGK